MNSEIERLAGEAGLDIVEMVAGTPSFVAQADIGDFCKFVGLLVEECAKECESQLTDGECPERAQYCADAIRAKFALSHPEYAAK